MIEGGGVVVSKELMMMMRERKRTSKTLLFILVSLEGERERDEALKEKKRSRMWGHKKKCN
jgi:hypothetical protein